MARLFFYSNKALLGWLIRLFNEGLNHGRHGFLVELAVGEDDAEGDQNAAAHGGQTVGTVFPLG